MNRAHLQPYPLSDIPYKAQACLFTNNEHLRNISSGQASKSLTCPSSTKEDSNAIQSQISPTRNGQTDSDLRHRLGNVGVRTPQRSITLGRSADCKTSKLRNLREARGPSAKEAACLNSAHPSLAARPSSLDYTQPFGAVDRTEKSQPSKGGLGVPEHRDARRAPWSRVSLTAGVSHA